MSDNVFYITTPIYYINATPHIGHAYTQIAADARARFERMRGRQVYFLTGTDEHGAKVARAAQELGRDVQQHADELSAQFRTLWDALGISYDDYIRTTEPRHTKVAQRVLQKLWDGGHLALGNYSSWYSVPDETFIRAEDVEERDSAHYIANPTEDQSRQPLEWVEETTHFFKLSAFERTLQDLYAARPEMLQPTVRRNETVAFINSGLRDASISRELDWGVPLPPGIPGAEKHSIYVWFEALLNYISAPGYLSDDPFRRDLFEQTWPCDVHLMSKDIFTRFHATLWPAILTALELPLPRQLFAHGFWTVNGRKMSKREPETIVEPLTFAREIAAAAGCEEPIAVDALRYYCLREVTFGSDGDFSQPGCYTRYNSDLANGWGNLVNRALSMLQQYFDGVVPTPHGELGLRQGAIDATPAIEAAYASMDYSTALEAVWRIIADANRMIEEQKPWAKMKSGEQDAVATLLGELLAVCEWTSIVMTPVMPHASRRLRQLLAIGNDAQWSEAATLTAVGTGHRCEIPAPLFPRVSSKANSAGTKPEAAPKAAPKTKPQSQEKSVNESNTTQATVTAVAPAPEAPVAAATATSEPNTPAPQEAPPSNLINYEDFAKVELRTALVVEAEKVPKADKLLCLQVEVGGERRQILAGIAQQYTPEQMIGKTIVIVANLAPRKLRGLESQGMLLAASVDADSPAGALLTIDTPLSSGAFIK